MTLKELRIKHILFECWNCCFSVVHCRAKASISFNFHRIVMQPRMRWPIWHSSDSTTTLLLEPLPQCVVLDRCSPRSPCSPCSPCSLAFHTRHMRMTLTMLKPHGLSGLSGQGRGRATDATAGQWASRSFVRDSLAAVLPDQAEKIRTGAAFSDSNAFRRNISHLAVRECASIIIYPCSAFQSCTTGNGKPHVFEGQLQTLENMG